MAGAVGRAQSVTALSPAGFWARWWQFGYAKAVFTSTQLAGPLVRPFLPRLARGAVGRRLIDGAFVARPSAMPAEQAAADALAFFAARATVRAVLAERVSFTGRTDTTDSPGSTGAVPADVPVTIAWGTRDRLLPPSQARVAARHLPRARFVSLPGCGHVPMTDDPALVARVLLEGSEQPADRG